MIRFLKAIYYFFSPYAHPFERRADRFFRHIKSSSTAGRVHKDLLKLMRENLVVLDLWMEKKYKNYVYLKKRVRKRKYADTERLKADFLAFAETHKPSAKRIEQKLANLGLTYPLAEEAKLVYLATIMTYLKPGPRYKYQAGANFGKLLCDPTKKQLIGDCNQITTLYTYFYGLQYDVDDLQIKILPKHVCLHFRGIDIEATNGTFQNYTDFEYVLPITELISTNLLDVADEEERTGDIDPRTIVKRAQFAQKISSMKSLVEKNLKVAYHNLGLRLSKERNYKSALFFLEKTGDRKLVQQIARNAAIYLVEQRDWRQAHHYAKKAADPEIERFVTHREGYDHYKKGKYLTAIPYFQKIGEEEMVNACYRKEYNRHYQRVKNVKTVAEAKRYKSVYRKLRDLARKATLDDAERWASGMLKKL